MSMWSIKTINHSIRKIQFVKQEISSTQFNCLKYFPTRAHNLPEKCQAKINFIPQGQVSESVTVTKRKAYLVPRHCLEGFVIKGVQTVGSLSLTQEAVWSSLDNRSTSGPLLLRWHQLSLYCLCVLREAQGFTLTYKRGSPGTPMICLKGSCRQYVGPVK